MANTPGSMGFNPAWTMDNNVSSRKFIHTKLFLTLTKVLNQYFITKTSGVNDTYYIQSPREPHRIKYIFRFLSNILVSKKIIVVIFIFCIHYTQNFKVYYIVHERHYTYYNNFNLGEHTINTNSQYLCHICTLYEYYFKQFIGKIIKNNNG